jgi:pseudouridine-5'-phosphate glycosidase
MFRVNPLVQRALHANEPVVALESTVLTHGLPRPENLALAQNLEAIVRDAGAVPATVGVLAGELVVGLELRELEQLAYGEADKASLWNLAALVSQRRDAGTTVAATLHASALAGIRVFATGGIGGVHAEAFDESADLAALARYPVVTVCAGPKSVLNVAATLERLESLGVAVVGYQSGYLAGFYVRESELPVPQRCDTPDEVAGLYRAQLELGLASALLVCKPVSSGLAPEELSTWLEQAWRELGPARGQGVTPSLLARLAELSQGRTVEVNLQLLKENAVLAAEIARALSAAPQPRLKLVPS